MKDETTQKHTAYIIGMNAFHSVVPVYLYWMKLPLRVKATS